jgi:hypothetical protein
MEVKMRKRKRKTVRRVIPMTPEANAYLNTRAKELGLTGAEYLRRLVFIECYQGLVFDDLRAIAAEAGTGAMPMEDYLPYERAFIQRLREGIEEVRQLRTLARGVDPQLEQAEVKLTTLLRQKEEEITQNSSIMDMVRTIHKLAEGTAHDATQA